MHRGPRGEGPLPVGSASFHLAESLERTGQSRGGFFFLSEMWDPLLTWAPGSGPPALDTRTHTSPGGSSLRHWTELPLQINQGWHEPQEPQGLLSRQQ